MLPVEQIIPGVVIPTVLIAKDQPHYLPLPAHVSADGAVTTRWKLSWKERFQVFFGGHMWLTQLTFGDDLQPVKLVTKCPLKVSADV